jgi:hypothetical protein
VKNHRVALLGLALAAVMTGCGGCGGCGKEETASNDAGAETPVAAPPNLLAEGVIPTPDSTWSRFQRGVGGLMAIMAPTIGGLAASMAGSEPWLGVEIDGGSPAYAVMAGSPPTIVVALRLRNAAHVRESLAGDSGRFHAAGQQDALALFEPAASGLALGIAQSGWIVIGKTKEAVAAMGPYAYRTLPTRPLPKANLHADFVHDVSGRCAAFSTWLVPLAMAKWVDTKVFLLTKDSEARASHGGREPDFGDARAIVALIDRWLAARADAVNDMKSGALDADVREDVITATLSLEPGAGDSKAMLDSMRPGPIAIGALPPDTLLAVAMRDDLAGRKETAKATADGLTRILGKRLTEDDGKQLVAALDGWASARGDWFGVAAGEGYLIKAPAGQKANEATKDLVALADKAAFRPPIDALTRTSVKAPIAWDVKDGAIRVAISPRPQAVLDGSTDPRISAALDKVGDASFAIAGHAKAPDPISTLATKQKNGRLEVVVDGAPTLVRDVIKLMTSGM